MAALVRAQHGVVSAAQLGAAGMSEGAIRRRVQAGRLRRVHRGVYAVGPMDLSQHGCWMAAVLACGQGAVLSHQSAAVLWKIGSSAAVVEVTVPTRGGRRRRPGIVVHRAPLGGHVSSRDRIPVTTPARTLFDLASAVTLRELERAFDEAERLRLLKLGAIQALLAANPGRRGAANLRVVMGSHRPGSTRTRTYLEEQFFAACNRGGIPRPDVNVEVGQDTVDFLWRKARLVVETDGEGSHLTRYAFEEDRARDVRLALLGYQVVRFTYRQLEDDPDAVVVAVKALLYGRRSDRELPMSRATSNSGSG